MGIPPIGVGKNCLIRKAIIDKNARIGEGAKIINQRNIDSFESEMYSIKDGIVVIPKNTQIPPGTVI
jgi:glucose-1-phosphate adenylyltransferase